MGAVYLECLGVFKYNKSEDIKIGYSRHRKLLSNSFYDKHFSKGVIEFLKDNMIGNVSNLIFGASHILRNELKKISKEKNIKFFKDSIGNICFGKIQDLMEFNRNNNNMATWDKQYSLVNCG